MKKVFLHLLKSVTVLHSSRLWKTAIHHHLSSLDTWLWPWAINSIADVLQQLRLNNYTEEERTFSTWTGSPMDGHKYGWRGVIWKQDTTAKQIFLSVAIMMEQERQTHEALHVGLHLSAIWRSKHTFTYGFHLLDNAIPRNSRIYSKSDWLTVVLVVLVSSCLIALCIYSSAFGHRRGRNTLMHCLKYFKYYGSAITCTGLLYLCSTVAGGGFLNI